MYIKVLFLALFGFVVATSGAAKDKLHDKRQIPGLIDHHHHTQFPLFDDEEKPRVARKPIADVKYHYGSGPIEDGYKKSWKSSRSEKYQTETVDNPHSDNPANKYVVKTSYKVREKLPYFETTIGYDHDYEYPASEGDFDYQKNEKIVDFNSAKTDPFPGDTGANIHSFFDGSAKKNPHVGNLRTFLKSEEKPKNNYYYKFPENKFEYQKTAHDIDFYLKHNSPDEVSSKQKKPQKSEDYGFNEIDYDLPKGEKYETSSDFDTGYKADYEEKFQADLPKPSDFERVGPSEAEIYGKYKTDGPSYNYNL